MRPYFMKFNEHVNGDFGVLMYDYETYSGGQKRRESTAVAGRRGELVSKPTSSGNVTIDVTFSVFGHVKTNIDALKRWLKGTGKLSFSDQPDFFYKVYAIDWGDIERELRKYGRFTASFACEPYKFKNDGQNEYAPEYLSLNPYDTAHPIYQITGDGMCTLTVNGNEMTANIGQNLTIDTDRMIAYRNDGTLMNTAVTGDYEDLYLLPGQNSIEISDGFTMTVIPQWGYEI